MFGGDQPRRQEITDLYARVARLEAALNHLASQLGVNAQQLQQASEAGGLPAEARELADAGQTIAAIKAYRDATHVGLKQAKDAVEAYQRSR